KCEELGHLRGLKPHDSQVEPSLIPVDHFSERCQYQDQKDYANTIQVRRYVDDAAIVDQCRHKEHNQPDPQPLQLPFPQSGCRMAARNFENPEGGHTYYEP